MSEKSQKKDKKTEKSKGKVEKAHKAGKDAKAKEQKQKQRAVANAFNLLADDKAVDATLSSLFAVKQPAVKAKPPPAPEPRVARQDSSEEEAEDEDNDAELSEIDEDEAENAMGEMDVDSDAGEGAIEPVEEVSVEEGKDEPQSKRKRKRKDADEELEDAYMSRLAKEEERDAERMAAERAAKRQKAEAEKAEAEDEDESEEDEEKAAEGAGSDEDEDDEDAISPPPKHETQQQADDDLAKANRTVFLGNVSTDAITSKSSRKTLENHLKSFFDDLAGSKDTKPKLESIRFRSTAYASAIPKKASFAKKELMDATTKSSNAYAVYSSPALAREAAKRLNGTVVLGRHLRVDEIAHPAVVDHRRCIFVGNLGFVDDESNIQDANEEEGREKRKRGKEPADVEEGLWRTFMKCGKVESVRVIRDSTTRVGKGIAYVQFEDENAVEAALLYNEKKFPPMLPRKLRISRAKAQKRNAKPGSDRPGAPKPSANGYQRKLTGEEASKMGRTGKLLGRAAAAKVRRPEGKPRAPRENKPSSLGEGIKKPESFIFEGHRASEKQGKSGLKLAGRHGKNKTKVTKRSSSFKKAKKT